MHGLRKGTHQSGFGKPGHAFEQAVPPGQHGDEQLLDDLALAHDGLGNFGADPAVHLQQQGGLLEIPFGGRLWRIGFRRNIWGGQVSAAHRSKA
jgi:hypothetical protein